MKGNFLLLLILILSACSTTGKKYSVIPDSNAEYAMQHTYFAVAIAKFYCDHLTWPQNITALKTEASKSKIAIVQKIYWPYFLKNGVVYNIRNPKQVYLRTPGNTQQGIISVSALHGIPVCKDNGMELNFRPTLGG